MWAAVLKPTLAVLARRGTIPERKYPQLPNARHSRDTDESTHDREGTACGAS